MPQKKSAPPKKPLIPGGLPTVPAARSDDEWMKMAAAQDPNTGVREGEYTQPALDPESVVREGEYVRSVPDPASAVREDEYMRPKKFRKFR